MEEPRDAVVSADCRNEPKSPAAATTTPGEEAGRPAPPETSATSNTNGGTSSANNTSPANATSSSSSSSTANAEPPTTKKTGRQTHAKNKKKHRRTRSRVVKTAVPAEDSNASSGSDSESDDGADVSDDSDSSDELDDEKEDADNGSDSDSSSDSSSGDDARATKKLKKLEKKLKKMKKKQKKTKVKAKKNEPKSKKRDKLTKSKKSKRTAQSDSDSSSDADDTDVDDAANANATPSTKDLEDQLQTLRVQFSTLQQQLTPSSLGSYPYPPGGYSGYVGGLAGAGLGGGLGGLGGPPGLGNNSLDPPNSINSQAPGRRGLGSFRPRPPPGAPPGIPPPVAEGSSDASGDRKKKKRKGMRTDFKRVDWIWDTSNYTFKLQDTTEANTESQYSDYLFHVRRTFDYEGKYRTTFVDIKSKLLRECLQDVIGNVRGVSLVDETPKMDPNMLFLYLEEFRTHLKHLKQAKPAGSKKRERKKNQKRLNDKRKHLRVLIKYIDKDYAKVKDSLYPMLENGLITFDLLWALWKPNTLAYATTYGSSDEPRAFKIEIGERQSSLMKGDSYYIDGKYFEFDGKRFGFGGVAEEIPEFQGACKITSLSCYPLQYHKDEAGVRARLIERGKKFVALSGVNYRTYSGMAYFKRKKGIVVKFNIQHSRVMVDPAIFRRTNPNYYVSVVRPKDHDLMSEGGFSDDDSDCCGCASDDDEGGDDKVKFVTKIFKNGKGEVCMARLPKDDVNEDDDLQEPLDALPARDGEGKKSPGQDTPAEEEEAHELTDEEYLIASPVVLGFAFSEKQWLEFSVSGIKDIKWNEDAWDSLVLEPETKDLIQALVKSRKYSAAQTIDDVIQGKGKGLVTVLHGPPGTGKTLTAEGISELLKCPLYMASAGELGTDSRFLEQELQKILDICHAWGAILLLDEADVFLEKRNMHDIHRNALVSIFLRQLEYFQGILFLTTNRVERFDEAFQSRIHIALRYDNLDAKAKKAIFKMFIERVRALGKMELEGFSDEDFTGLAKHELNGREIKNVVGSAQDLAVNKGEALSMRHIRQVLDVHAKFGRDLRGGTGYEEAMRSYF